jgi:hypothetical protein
MNVLLTFLLFALQVPAFALAFTSYAAANAPFSRSTVLSAQSFFEHLQFDGKPSFDVLKKTQEYVANRGKNPETIFADDYVLRGPVIGPLTRKDLTSTQGSLNVAEAFPDIQTNPFGFTQDPENPYRVFFFEKWRATHTGPLQAGSTTIPPTGKVMDGPVHCNAITWNPDGKIMYESVGNVIDRHEGNTEGKAAVFGLLHTAGLKLPGTPGSMQLRLVQRIGHLVGGTGRSFSKEEDIPDWWKSKSRGADPTDPS